MPDAKIWKPLELAKATAEYFAGKGVPTPKLDAELLLCRILKLPRRIDLYAGFERAVTDAELAAYRELVRRRAAREPVSRLLGEREFMGLTFSVTPAVFSPRPETELLVEAALEALSPRKMSQTVEAAADLDAALDCYGEDVDDEPGEDGEVTIAASASVLPRENLKKTKKSGRNGDGCRVLDLGTGSGCIAVSLAAMLPGASVVAVDVSEAALAVARKNAETAGVAVEFRCGEWFRACPDGEMFDLIASNPPYLIRGDEEIWPEAALYDPELALYGGADGLDAYRALAAGMCGRLNPGGWVFLEVGRGQDWQVSEMLRAGGLTEIVVLPDHAGIARVVSARRM